MNILIAEDGADTAAIYRVALESRGHKVTITPDGLECLRAYEDAVRKKSGDGSPSFDVVVLDYRMPRLSGLETAKALLNINPEQRIIFASAYVKETLRDAVKDLEKVVELIEKPFEPKSLVELIENTSAIQQLREINELVTSMEISDMSIAGSDVRKGLERMSSIFGPVIIRSLIAEFEEKGIRSGEEEWYSAGHLQSLLKSTFGDHTGIFLMRFFIGYFQNRPQVGNRV